MKLYLGARRSRRSSPGTGGYLGRACNPWHRGPDMPGPVDALRQFIGRFGPLMQDFQGASVIVSGQLVSTGPRPGPDETAIYLMRRLNCSAQGVLAHGLTIIGLSVASSRIEIPSGQ